jgi:hypothetical protein
MLKVAVGLFLVSLYISIPIGFDLFFHVFSYQPSVEFGSSLNRSHTLFDFVVPRYIFLSYIYYLASYLGFPIFFIIIFLVGFPLNSILTALILKKRRAYLFDFLVLIFCCLLTLFFSALSLSLLWFVAFLYTRQKIFSFGFFHPVAIIFLPLIMLINRAWMLKYIFILSLFSLALFILIGLDVDVYSRSLAAPFVISFDNLFHITIESILLKKKEFSLVLLLAAFFFFTRRIRISGFSSEGFSLFFVCFSILIAPIAHERSIKGIALKGEVDLVFGVLSGQLTENSYHLFRELRNPE